MPPIDKTRKLMRLNDMATLQDGWIVGIPAPSEIAINNAKAITTALCALGIEHWVYPLAVETNGIASSGIQFEIAADDVEIELICRNSGAIETEEFVEDLETSIRELVNELDAVKPVQDNALRTCEHNEADVVPHTCPFAEDVGGDTTTLCKCCIGCQTQCAQDI